MHLYSSDEAKAPIYAYLAIIAVVLAWSASAATAWLPVPPWLISAPAMAPAFVVTYRIFEERIWRHPLLKRLGLVRTVDVTGTYTGKLISSWEDPPGIPVELDVTFDIVQTWTRISIQMEVTSKTSSSSSISAIAAISHDGAATCLSYIYRNKKDPARAALDMGDHDGAADIRIFPDGRLKGRYFNSRPRAGSIEARKLAGGARSRP